MYYSATCTRNINMVIMHLKNRTKVERKNEWIDVLFEPWILDFVLLLIRHIHVVTPLIKNDTPTSATEQRSVLRHATSTHRHNIFCPVCHVNIRDMLQCISHTCTHQHTVGHAVKTCICHACSPNA